MPWGHPALFCRFKDVSWSPSPLPSANDDVEPQGAGTPFDLRQLPLLLMDFRAWSLCSRLHLAEGAGAAVLGMKGEGDFRRGPTWPGTGRQLVVRELGPTTVGSAG